LNKWIKNYTLKVQGTDTLKELHIIELPFTVEFNYINSVMGLVAEADFKIYNLKESVRNVLFKDWYEQDKKRYVAFYVGYGDSPMALFKGDCWTCYNQKTKTDWETSMTCHSAYSAMSGSYTSYTFDAGTTKSDNIRRLMNDIIKHNTNLSLGQLSIGKISDYVDPVSKKPITHLTSVTFKGTTSNVLKKYTQGDFFISNNKLYSLSKYDSVEGVVSVISSQTGLLGTPRRAKTYIEVDMILEPNMRLFQYINLETKYKGFSGKYKVLGVIHTGTISGSVDSEATTTVTLGTDKTLAYEAIL